MECDRGRAGVELVWSGMHGRANPGTAIDLSSASRRERGERRVHSKMTTEQESSTQRHESDEPRGPSFEEQQSASPQEQQQGESSTAAAPDNAVSAELDSGQQTASTTTPRADASTRQSRARRPPRARHPTSHIDPAYLETQASAYIHRPGVGVVRAAPRGRGAAQRVRCSLVIAPLGLASGSSMQHALGERTAAPCTATRASPFAAGLQLAGPPRPEHPPDAGAQGAGEARSARGAQCCAARGVPSSARGVGGRCACRPGSNGCTKRQRCMCRP